jgi:hypothetical protein
MNKSHIFDENELDTIFDNEVNEKFKDSEIIDFEGAKVNKQTYQNILIKKMAEDVSDEMINDTLKDLKESSDYFNYLLTRKKRKIRSNLKDTIGLLKSVLLKSIEIGKELVKKNKLIIKDNIVDVPNEEATKYLLIRIHERTQEIVGEIICLLENGFSMGAHARWRTLNEYMVLTNIFTKEDSHELSYKYLRHDVIGYKKSADDLFKHAKHKVPDYEDINKDYDELISKYGVEYRKDYGWYTPNPNINFIDLAIKYNSHVLLGYARKSSMANHGSSQDLIFQNYKQYKDLINEYEILVQNVIINLCTINQTIMLFFMNKEKKYTVAFFIFMNYFGKLHEVIAKLFFTERYKIDKSKPRYDDL